MYALSLIYGFFPVYGLSLIYAVSLINILYLKVWVSYSIMLWLFLVGTATISAPILFDPTLYFCKKLLARIT